MKFSAKCITKKLGMIYTIWEVFAYFLIGERADKFEHLRFNAPIGQHLFIEIYSLSDLFIYGSCQLLVK